MDSLLIHDSFECYYAGRDTGFVERKTARDERAAFPAKRVAISRERLLPVRLGDHRTIRQVKTR